VATFNRCTLLALVLGLIGVVLDAILLARWIGNDLELSSPYYPGVFGLLLIVLAFQTFTFPLLAQIVTARDPRG
jgi:hypothetical protein